MSMSIYHRGGILFVIIIIAGEGYIATRLSRTDRQYSQFMSPKHRDGGAPPELGLW